MTKFTVTITKVSDESFRRKIKCTSIEELFAKTSRYTERPEGGHWELVLWHTGPDTANVIVYDGHLE